MSYMEQGFFYSYLHGIYKYRSEIAVSVLYIIQ